VVVVVQRQGPGGDGAAHHDDRGGCGAGHLVQQGQDLVGKLLLRHLTDRSSSLSISMFLVESLVEQC
jgi:hypothetical protein